MSIFTIFRTDKETDETKVVGQTTKERIIEQVPLVTSVTGQKVKSAGKTSNTSVFNTEDYKVDFIDKDSLGGNIPL